MSLNLLVGLNQGSGVAVILALCYFVNASLLGRRYSYA